MTKQNVLKTKSEYEMAIIKIYRLFLSLVDAVSPGHLRHVVVTSIKNYKRETYSHSASQNLLLKLGSIGI